MSPLSDRHKTSERTEVDDVSLVTEIPNGGRMKIKSVFRYDRESSMLRLFRIVGERGSTGFGGYSWKLSAALRPALFRFNRELEGWILTVLGLRIHYKRSYGGRFV